MATVKNPFVWTEIYVEDMERAQKFYETVLQVKMEAAKVPEGMVAEEGNDEQFEMVFFPGDMASYGNGGSLVRSNMIKPGVGGSLNYFGCEDCSIEISRVTAAGGKVVSEKMSIGEYGFCGICLDSEGNQIGFHSMK